MKGKLSWMVFSIIGGAIVAAVLIFVYFVMVKGMILSQLSVSALRPWMKFVLNYQHAEKYGTGSVTPFQLDFHLVEPMYTYSDLTGVECRTKALENIEKTYRSFNAILILNPSEVKYFNSKFGKYSTNKRILSKCGKGYCICAVHIDLKSGYYLNLREIDDSGECTFPSIVTGIDLRNCVGQTASKIMFIGCERVDKPLKYNDEDVKMIQFIYTRGIFFKGEKDDVEFSFIQNNDCFNGNCILILNECPISNKLLNNLNC